MGWLDPTSWITLGQADSGDLKHAFGIGADDPRNPDRQGLRDIGGQAGGFGNQLAGNYGQNQAGINQSIQNLRDLASGKNSVSAEQLRQGMQQGLAAQQSMAAGAGPQNQAMAARNAAMNMGRLGYGLSGQQALAGLQERNQATQNLAQLQLGQSGQNLQGALGGYGAATGAYGQAIGNPQSTWGPMLMGAIQGGAQMGAAAASDRRLKKNVKDGDKEARQTLNGLNSVSYDYKDEKYGAGRQFGLMAQDMEKTPGLRGAVINTPAGKMVNGAKAALAGLALTANLHQRLSKLEAKK